jgi:general secretion pathway protein K
MMKRHHAERGVAIITALVVVAAATVAVSAMLWRESIAVRKVENQAALGQARWLARSAIEWARLVLLQDARTSAVDHLGEIWAVPLAETKVTDDLATAQPDVGAPPGTSAAPFADNEAAYVSGRMHDAQARFNLQGLAAGDQVDTQRFTSLARLLDVLNLDHDLAKAFAQRIAMPPRYENFDALARAMVDDGSLPAAAADRLRPFVALLPTPTPVNLNTAPAEVLAAMFPNLPLDAARALVRSREQAWFTQVGDVGARLPGSGGEGTPANVSVTTNWFEVEGRVRVGRADLQVAGLIEREQNGTTRVRSLAEQ